MVGLGFFFFFVFWVFSSVLPLFYVFHLFWCPCILLVCLGASLRFFNAIFFFLPIKKKLIRKLFFFIEMSF
jgi:hypothetical protein